MNTIDDITKTPCENTVWVTNISFVEELRSEKEGWIAIDEHGNTVFVSSEKGGIQPAPTQLISEDSIPNLDQPIRFSK